MRSPRPPRLQPVLAALVLAVLALVALGPALAQPGPQQGFFGYSRVNLPLIHKPASQSQQPTPQARIVAWLDIPGQVRLTDRLQVIINVRNDSSFDFTGRTEVVIPYEGRKFYAADSSFDRGRGDWVRQNRFPTDLTVEFGPLRRGELRRGVIYFDLRANGADAQVGDKLRIRGRHNNGLAACGQDVCAMNQRFVEVVSQFTGGSLGPLQPGGRQVQKLGDIRYGEQRRWAPEGFRPGEEVVTWLNTADGGQRPLTLQQQADSNGKVYFNLDAAGLRNGFYSIVAHGKDTRIEIVGEFQVISLPVLSVAAVRPVLIALPTPAAAPAADAGAQLAATPAQTTGRATLTGAVAAGGTAGSTRLEGVQVSVIAADGSVVGAAPTDSFGGYQIGGLPAGNYTVSFDPHLSLSDAARRYQPQSRPAVSIPEGGTARLDAELVAGSTVGGVVSGAGAGGLEGVSVLLLSGDALVEATTTGPDGRYALEGVPSGSYTLQFDPATSADPSVRAFAGASLPAFDVAAPSPQSGRSVVLSRSASVVEVGGQVVAADDGRPLPGVFVALERLNPASAAYEYAGLAVTGEDGAYSAVVPPGRYRVAFRPGFAADPDSARYLGEYFDNTQGPSGATSLDLAGGATGRADAALTAGATIAGTVSVGEGPLADVAVLAYDAASGALADITLTGEDGAYRTAGLPAGSYRLEFATFLAANEATQRYAGTAREQVVALTAGAAVAGVDATLSLGGQIAGKVTGTGGVALADVLVLAVDTAGTAAVADDALAGVALTGADGTYTTSGLPAGPYVVAFVTELTAGPDVLAYFDEYYNDAVTLAEADPVTVAVGATTGSINAALTQGGQIRGRVTDAAGGFGLAGVLVEVYATGDPATLVGFAITDERGDYATTALPTGASYLVRFNPSAGGGLAAYAPEYFDDASGAGAAQAIPVPSTAPVTDIDAALAPQG